MMLGAPSTGSNSVHAAFFADSAGKKAGEFYTPADVVRKLRNEAMSGRTDIIEGLTKEATTFYDYVVQLAFENEQVPKDCHEPLKNLVRAPHSIPDERIEHIVESKRYWIYKNLAEWRDLNATRVLREYRNGEGFLYLGRSYRLQLVAGQEELLLLRNGAFCLRRDLVDRGAVEATKSAFRDYYIARGLERIGQRVAYYAPKVGVTARHVAVRDLGNRWASCSPKGKVAFHWKCMMRR